MKLNKLTAEQLTRLYREELKDTFPPTELKPLAVMLSLSQENRYEALGLFDGDRLLGYALLGLEPGVPLALLDYLGVMRGIRNQGYGAIILDLLADYYRDYRGIFGEAEDPAWGDPAEEELRRRRLGFYHRNGFRYGGYDCALFGVRYQALVRGDEDITPQELTEPQRIIPGRPLSSDLSRRFLQIPLNPGEEPNPPGNWSEE